MKLLHNKSPQRRRIWFLIGGVCLLPVLTIAMLNPTNSAATRPDHTDSQLRTRVYRVAPSAVVSTVREIVPQLRTYGRTWRLRPASGSQDSVVIACEVPVLLFTDDLEVSIQAQGEQTQVDVQSRSRVGRGDFGENRRHIVQLLRALDAQLLPSPPK